MAKIHEVYKCEKCGNIVEVLHGGPGKLFCCGAEMVLFEEKEADSSTEKHVPVYEKDGNVLKVKVGSIEHPMTQEHYIEWIEVITENKVYRKHLKPGDKPEAVFEIKESDFEVREYCSIHGLWKS